ncbi:MAG: hypothetical protein JXB04_03460 [Kiritimatiellae bacterium]|nr:hypothetical protein [Kiritimatiellia bacterium]
MTIVEVVLALAILCLVMASSYSMITWSAMSMRRARNRYVAITLAENRLERAGNLDYNTLYLTAEDKVIVDENGAPSEFGGFRRSTVVDKDYVMELTDGTNTLILTNTHIDVTVEIRDIQSGQFAGSQVNAATIFTEYLERIDVGGS